MIAALTLPLARLYETDETAWLESMARLAEQGDWANMDHSHLAEYLHEMARRDKREIESRLAILVAHLLKWQYQPSKRSRSWQLTTATQRQELRRLLSSLTLRAHAEDVLGEVYADGLEQAAIESGIPKANFPVTCPYTLDDVIEQIELAEPTADEENA